MSTSSFEDAYLKVSHLAETFHKSEGKYLSIDYQEAEVRKDFIDKFWIALGWDVNHDQQTNPYEQEVKVERTVTVGTTQRRADYGFYLAPNFRDPRFYVEAKKPRGDIANPDYYFQAVRYGWNSRHPVSVLTDFEQFHILDCRHKPDVASVLTKALAKYRYSDYADRGQFERIYWFFSREALATGSFDRIVHGLPTPKGRTAQARTFAGTYKPVDEAFLEELDEFRTTLARTFKNNNSDLDGATLTELAQRTLDRLVFLQFLEDRGIETSRLVGGFGDSRSSWQDFVATSSRLDSVYNGIVFKQHDILDSAAFRVDGDAFSGICRRLASANTPYDFNFVPIHILGSIYERFLGKVIVATEKRVRVELKPEVRKAGGVYYTPEYIVRYIVNKTVGEKISGKTPAEIAQMRFADIACGSGSFLLGIYDTLLDYHGQYYNANPKKAKKGECVERDGTLYLSLGKKREILLNNIFGVDIDPQAVEVAQFSLYLRLLKEETPETTNQLQLAFAHDARLKKLLPDLSRNIRCGNSLVESDILTSQSLPPEREREIHPMDFRIAFPEVMGNGGFDVIVGNPPYVRIQGLPREQVEYLTHRYASATGNCDVYVSFVERGYSLLREGGYFGYIVPNKFLKTDYGVGLRGFLSEHKAIRGLIDFGASQVFDATTYTCLLFLSNENNNTFLFAQSEADPSALAAAMPLERSSASINENSWLLSDAGTAQLIEKLTSRGTRLLDLPAQMNRGSSTGNDDAFLVKQPSQLEQDALRIPLFASDFGRYSFAPERAFHIIFPYKVDSDGYRLLTERELREQFPSVYAHLKSKSTELRKRKQFKAWFGYSAPRSLPQHECAQIAVPLLADRGIFAMVPPEMRSTLCMMASGGFSITISPSAPAHAEYVLGLLNSRLLFWYLRQISNVFRGGWITCTKQYFGELPIAVPGQVQHDKLVEMVQEILTATKHSGEARTDRDKAYYQDKCALLDRRIDESVYEIYGLTKQEIALVEDGTPK